MPKADWYHECPLSEEMCELWCGWDRVLDYLIATHWPDLISSEADG